MRCYREERATKETRRSGRNPDGVCHIRSTGSILSQEECAKEGREGLEVQQMNVALATSSLYRHQELPERERQYVLGRGGEAEVGGKRANEIYSVSAGYASWVRWSMQTRGK